MAVDVTNDSVVETAIAVVNLASTPMILVQKQEIVHANQAMHDLLGYVHDAFPKTLSAISDADIMQGSGVLWTADKKEVVVSTGVTNISVYHAVAVRVTTWNRYESLIFRFSRCMRTLLHELRYYMENDSLDSDAMFNCYHAIVQLTTDMTDIINLDMNKIKLQNTNYNVETTLQSLYKEIVRANPEVDLQLELASELPIVYGDVRRFRQVILTLVNNAIRATKSGQIILSAEHEKDIHVSLTYLTSHDLSNVDSNEFGLSMPLAQRLVQHMGYDRGISRTNNPSNEFKYSFKLTSCIEDKKVEGLSREYDDDQALLNMYQRIKGMSIAVIEPNPLIRTRYCEILSRCKPSRIVEMERYDQATLTINDSVDIILMSADNFEFTCSSKQTILIITSDINCTNQNNTLIKPFSPLELFSKLSNVELNDASGKIIQRFNEALIRKFIFLQTSESLDVFLAIRDYATFLKNKAIVVAAMTVMHDPLNKVALNELQSFYTNPKINIVNKINTIQHALEIKSPDIQSIISNVHALESHFDKNNKLVQVIMSSLYQALTENNTMQAKRFLNHMLVEMEDRQILTLHCTCYGEKNWLASVPNESMHEYQLVVTWYDSVERHDPDIPVDIILIQTSCMSEPLTDLNRCRSRVPDMVPIIILGADDELSWREVRRAHSAGADGFLTIPIRPVDMKSLDLLIKQKQQVHNPQFADTLYRDCLELNRGNALLLIEDNKLHAQYMIDLCANHGGYRVQHVMTCNDALDAMQCTQYSVVLFDPGSDGHVFIPKLRENISPTSPVIVISANQTIDVAQACINAGADGYLVKPLTQHGVLMFWLASLRRVWQQKDRELIETRTRTAVEVEQNRRMRIADNDLYHLMKNIFGGMLGLLDCCTDDISHNERMRILEELAQMCISGQETCSFRQLLNDVVAKQYQPSFDMIQAETWLLETAKHLAVDYKANSEQMVITIDRRILLIILNNAVSNARKYGGKEQRPRLSVETQDTNVIIKLWNSPGKEHQALLNIAEQTHPRGSLDHLFTEQPARNRCLFSDGIGLETTRKCAAAVQYKVSLRIDRTGVTFLIEVPAACNRKSEQNIDQIVKTKKQQSSELDWTKIRICFLDDDPLIRKSYEYFIRKVKSTGLVMGASDHEIETFSDRVMEYPAHIVVIDQKLESPQRTRDADGNLQMVRRGTDVCQELLHRGYTGLLVARTANNNGANVQCYCEAGFHLILGKDVRMTAMIQMLEEQYLRFMTGNAC